MSFSKNFLKYLLVSILILPIAEVSAVTISPTNVKLSNAKKIVSLTFVNDTPNSINIQTSAFTWKQTDGKDLYAKSDDLVVVPPIVTIPANKSQIFRVTKKTFDSPSTEMSYRLYLEDVSPEFTDTKEAPGVYFKFNQNLPVYYNPSDKAKANASFISASLCSSSGEESCIRLDNNNNTHVGINNISINNQDVNTGGVILGKSYKEFRFKSTQKITDKIIVKAGDLGDITLTLKK